MNSYRITQVLLLFMISVVMLRCSSPDNTAEKARLETYMDTVSYIIGFDYGKGIRDEKIEVNPRAVFKGLSDGLEGKNLLSDSAKDQIIDDFNQILKNRLEEEGLRLLELNKTEGKQFMQNNLKQEGVVELSSGLQYKILKIGSGPKPSLQDSVFVHYRAMFTDRSVFDMSYDRGPAGFRLDEVITGLTEGVLLMNLGSIYELYIPPELAYGDKPFAKIIPGGTTLIYSIELIEIRKQKKN